MRRAIVQLAVRGTATLLATLMLLAAAPVQPVFAAGDSGSIAPAQSQSQHPIALVGDRLFSKGGTRAGTGTGNGDGDTDTDTDGDTGGTAAGTGTGGTTGDGTTAGTTGTANTTGTAGGTGTGGTTGDGTTAGTTGTVNTTGGTVAGTGTGGTTGDGTTAGTTGTVNTTAGTVAGTGTGGTTGDGTTAGTADTANTTAGEDDQDAVLGVQTPPSDTGLQAQGGGFDDSQVQGQQQGTDAATALLGVQQLPATATDPATAALLATLGASAIGAGLLVMRRR